MPYIRVTTPKGSLSLQQKGELAPRIVHALIRQEIDPVTDIGTAATGFFFNELEHDSCYPGGVPFTEHPERVFWTVECFVAESMFSQPRRDEMQQEVARAFVDVIGDDGTEMIREDVRIAPAYLMRIHVVFVNIEEGSWGAGGRTIETETIGKLLGATKGPERFEEALTIGKRLKEQRVA
jgi:phenylpyruvate tautomerase PptA (4-oxalocrotonate tautomerase family)